MDTPRSVGQTGGALSADACLGGTVKKAIHLSAVLAALLFGLLAVVAAPASAQSDIDDYSGPPSITVDKPEVECGDNVVVTGTGFPPNSKVDVTLPPGSGPTSVVGAIDGGGRARQVTTPPTIYSLADGSYIVTVDTDADPLDMDSSSPRVSGDSSSESLPVQGMGISK